MYPGNTFQTLLEIVAFHNNNCCYESFSSGILNNFKYIRMKSPLLFPLHYHLLPAFPDPLPALRIIVLAGSCVWWCQTSVKYLSVCPSIVQSSYQLAMWAFPAMPGPKAIVKRLRIILHRLAYQTETPQDRNTYLLPLSIRIKSP